MLCLSFMKAMIDTLNSVLLGMFFIAKCSICSSGFSIVVVCILQNACLHNCTSYFLCYSSSSLLLPYSLSFLFSFPVFLCYSFVPPSHSSYPFLSSCFCLFPIIILRICSFFSSITFLSFFTYCSFSHSFFPFCLSVLSTFFFFFFFACFRY